MKRYYILTKKPDKPLFTILHVMQSARIAQVVYKISNPQRLIIDLIDY